MQMIFQGFICFLYPVHDTGKDKEVGVPETHMSRLRCEHNKKRKDEVKKIAPLPPV